MSISSISSPLSLDYTPPASAESVSSSTGKRSRSEMPPALPLRREATIFREFASDLILSFLDKKNNYQVARTCTAWRYSKYILSTNTLYAFSQWKMLKSHTLQDLRTFTQEEFKNRMINIYSIYLHNCTNLQVFLFEKLQNLSISAMDEPTRVESITDETAASRITTMLTAFAFFPFKFRKIVIDPVFQATTIKALIPKIDMFKRLHSLTLNFTPIGHEQYIVESSGISRHEFRGLFPQLPCTSVTHLDFLVTHKLLSTELQAIAQRFPSLTSLTLRCMKTALVIESSVELSLRISTDIESLFEFFPKLKSLKLTEMTLSFDENNFQRAYKTNHLYAPWHSPLDDQNSIPLVDLESEEERESQNSYLNSLPLHTSLRDLHLQSCNINFPVLQGLLQKLPNVSRVHITGPNTCISQMSLALSLQTSDMLGKS